MGGELCLHVPYSPGSSAVGAYRVVCLNHCLIYIELVIMETR